MHLHLAALQKLFHSKVRNPFHIRVTMQQVILRPITKYYNHHIYKLKLIDHLRATRWMPPDYWQTNNSNGLVMIIRNYHWLNSASRVLILTCSAPLVQTGHRKQTHCLTLTLTYDLDLQSKASEGQGRPSCQKSRSKVKRFKQESTYRQTDRHIHTHTHGHYQTYYLPCYVVDN